MYVCLCVCMYANVAKISYSVIAMTDWCICMYVYMLLWNRLVALQDSSHSHCTNKRGILGLAVRGNLGITRTQALAGGGHHTDTSTVSLKQKVTIPVTKVSLPSAISKAAVAFGARAGPSQQPSQLRSVCKYAAALVAENPSHVWCSPLVANRKLNQRRLSTKYEQTNH
jgi:hypothetical protein